MPFTHPRCRSLSQRPLAIGEVAAVWMIVVAAVRLLGKTSFGAWQHDCFGYSFLSNLLFLFTPPLLVWALARRAPASSGLVFDHLTSQARIGLNAGVLLLLLIGWVFPTLQLLGTTYREWLGAIILASASLIALFVIVRTVGSYPDLPAGTGSRRHVLIFMLAVMVAFILGATSLRLARLAAGLVYSLIFVGFGEELFFRGYVQSRLNMAFARPFRLFGVQWGFGLVAAAVLHGLLHPLSLSTPQAWPWALWTAMVGMTLGMLREKTGSFVAPAIAHGLFVAPSVLLEPIWQ